MSIANLKYGIKDKQYLVTVRELRTRNFKRDLPFLILSQKLPEGQVYREFSDGRIEQQEVYTVGKTYHYRVLRVLPATEAEKVREEYGLH